MYSSTIPVKQIEPLTGSLVQINASLPHTDCKVNRKTRFSSMISVREINRFISTVTEFLENDSKEGG